MIKGLERKFILINMSIVTAMLLVIFGMVLHSTRLDLEEQSLRTMRFLLEDHNFPASRPGEATQSVQLPFFYVSVGYDGAVIAVKGGYFDLSDEESLEEIIAQANRSEADTGMLRDYNLRFCRKNTPFGQAMVFVDISSERATVNSLLKSCVVIGLLSFLAFLGLSFFLARWAVRPVEKAWNQQRQFVADASHELKTPLTVIMTNAELLSAEGYDESQRGQFASSILTMSQQMRGLVESLLELARVDNGTAKMTFSLLRFSDLAADALLPFEPVFFERGLMLESRVEPDIVVSGSPSHLKQVIDVLLDNAAKYSSPQGCVALTLKRQGSHCLLAVASPGEAIGKEDLKNIFRRFYRMDKARAMDHSYGLGLSIADSIVRQHGGRIWAESGDGINTFFVQLPLD